jgi:hypothetical protein
MATNRGILLTKSPYYITEAGSAGFTSTLEIRIWNGTYASEPASATYTLQKQALSNSSTQVVLEISRIIDEYFGHPGEPYTLSGTNLTDAVWVSVKTFGGSVNRDDYWLALNGYSYFEEDLNVDGRTALLISERIIYHNEGVPIRLPVYCDSSTYTYSVEFRLGASVQETVSLSANASSTTSYDKVKYVTTSAHSPGDIDNIVIKNQAGTILETIVVKDGGCTRYDSYVVSFINKHGVNQELPFTLVSKEKIRVRKKSYNRQILDVSGTPTYDQTKHQTKEYNSDAVESLTLTTNYIDESLNDTIGQLISSEYVWIKNYGGDAVTLPVNVSTTGLDYKTTVNDGLINYTIQFDYAFSKRQSVY